MDSPPYSPVISSPSASPRLRTQQNEEDKCSVCQEIPITPRSLPCHHVFCTHCIQGLLDDARNDGSSQVTCPNCRNQHDAPRVAADFPRALTVREPQSVIDVSREKLGPCKSCDKECDETTAYYCGECEGGICDECVYLHRRGIKAFRDHKFVPWSDADSFKTATRKRKCRFHEGYSYQLYCEACETFICAICLKENHVTHSDMTAPLGQVRDKKLAEMKKITEDADRQLYVLQARIGELRLQEESLVDHPESLEKTITLTFEDYMKQLRVWHRQLVTEAREKCIKTAKKLSAQQTDAENAIARLKTGIKYGRSARFCTNDDEIIETCTQSINQLKDALKDHEITPLQRPLVFKRKDMRLGELREIKEGDIQVITPKFCFMNSDNEITVKFNLPVNTHPVMKVLYGSRKQSFVPLRPTTPLPVLSSCEFSFFPRCAGKHTIEVWVGGAVCKTCHDVMIVRGAPEQTNRVKPGPDWQGNECIKSGMVMSTEQVTVPRQFGGLVDDGEEQESFKVKVQWDNGEVIDYDWGDDDEYELEVQVDH